MTFTKGNTIRYFWCDAATAIKESPFESTPFQFTAFRHSSPRSPVVLNPISSMLGARLLSFHHP